MTQKTYLSIVCGIFAIAGVFHLFRLIFKWDLSVAGWSVPFWVSAIGLLIAGFLAYLGFTLSNKS